MNVSLAQNFDVEFTQKVEGDYLLVGVTMQKTSGEDFKLGGANLPFLLNSTAVDQSQVAIVDSLSGKFSSKESADSYSGPYLGATEPFVHPYFTIKYSGGGDGRELTSQKENILTLSFPITDPCGSTELEWVNRGTITDYDNKRIKKNAEMINAPIFKLTPELSQPQVYLEDGILKAEGEGTFQWLLNGTKIDGATDSYIIPEADGQYSVETSNGCEAKVSNSYDHKDVKPQLSVSAAPNPYVSQTNITYTLPEQSDVTLEVFDMVGNKISTLFTGNQSEGQYNIPFSASQNGYTAGVYFVKLRVGEEIKTQRIVELNNN